MREHKKKWLFDKGKTSGSRKRWKFGGDFSDERNTKKFKDLEESPKKSSMKTGKVFNNRLSFAPLRRFLKSKVGKNWSLIYSEIKERIPSDVWEIHNPIEWYVYDNVEILKDGKIIDKKNMPVQGGNGYWWNYVSKDGITSERTRYGMFYVHPVTNTLCYLIPKVRKNKPEKKEAMKKHAQIKTEKNKSKKNRKEKNSLLSIEASNKMKEKKREQKNV